MRGVSNLHPAGTCPWAGRSTLSSTRGCGFRASSGCTSPTPRSCRWSPAATPTPLDHDWREMRRHGPRRRRVGLAGAPLGDTREIVGHNAGGRPSRKARSCRQSRLQFRIKARGPMTRGHRPRHRPEAPAKSDRTEERRNTLCCSAPRSAHPTGPLLVGSGHGTTGPISIWLIGHARSGS